MKRLTVRNSAGYMVLRIPIVCERCDKRDYNPVDENGDLLIEKLAAYEDTGLSPEEVAKLKVDLEAAKLARPYELTGDAARSFSLIAELGEASDACKRMRMERDALMADLQAAKPCGCCKHQNTDDCVLEDCLSACGEFIEGGIWEWRGLEGRA